MAGVGVEGYEETDRGGKRERGRQVREERTRTRTRKLYSTRIVV